MFILSKTLGVLLIPPGLILSLLVFACFALLRNQKKLTVLLLCLATFLLYLISTEPGKNLILLPLEDSYPHPDFKSINCKAIVVLGGGEIPHSPSESLKASVDPKVAKRLYEAFKLWKKTESLIVVSGGSVFHNAEPESTAMKRFLTTIGVPPQSILEEARSRNTLENAIFTRELLKERE